MSICRYNGLEGTHIKVTEFVRDKDCLVCGPGTLVELDTSSTLSDVSSNAKTSPVSGEKLLLHEHIFHQDYLIKIPHILCHAIVYASLL